jgi:NADPH2:quinone reductase
MKFINYKSQDFELQLAPLGVDVILDMVGGDYFAKNLNVLKPDGRLVYINSMKGNLVDLDISKMMQKRISITGSTLRARDSGFKIALARAIETFVWPVILSGRFKPVIYKTFQFSEAAKAHELMESSKHIGKIVLLNERLVQT